MVLYDWAYGRLVANKNIGREVCQNYYNASDARFVCLYDLPSVEMLQLLQWHSARKDEREMSPKVEGHISF